MSELQQFGDEVAVRRYEYDDGVVLAADFGPEREASVDVVDGTVIVVTSDDQYDIDVGGEADAFMSNGVLTIEVDA
ncbi:MAG: hypothetical protein V5A44_09470 [Haloarculaceae archaeon]